VTRYVGFLRAVNVGRGRKVPMAELRALLTDAGYGNVATYIQSGNVFFDTPSRSKEKLASAIEPLLADAFGFEIPIVLRTIDELEALVASKPFGPLVADDDTRLLVTFGPAKEWCDVIPVVNGKWVVPVGRKEGTGRFWHTLLKILEAAEK
jgi:uncharacterized protein (DUF1697 family)